MKVSKKTRARRKSVKVLDDAARTACFERDGHKCVRCGTDKGIQWAHVITRGRTSLRWLLENALTLCGGCHMFFWHKSPLESGNWFRETWPERFEMLMRLKDEYVKITAKDLKERAEGLNA